MFKIQNPPDGQQAGKGTVHTADGLGCAEPHVPFMFQVKASLSFCPSISMSSRMGTSTSGWDAFSWITAGSWSSKLEVKWQQSHQRVPRTSLSVPLVTVNLVGEKAHFLRGLDN